MEYKTITLDGFSVIGISVRTINKDGISIKDIGELWTTFWENNILSKIPGKISNEVYCIYTDYENDYTGYYTTILGWKVSSVKDIPVGMVAKQIPKAEYKQFKALGKIPESVGAVWSYIWQSDIQRQYIADFDVYGIKSQDSENPEVKVYIS